MIAVLVVAYFNVLLCAIFGKFRLTIAAMIIAFIYTIVFIAFTIFSKKNKRLNNNYQSSAAGAFTTSSYMSSMFTGQSKRKSKKAYDTSSLDDVSFDSIKSPSVNKVSEVNESVNEVNESVSELNESINEVSEVAPDIKNVGNI